MDTVAYSPTSRTYSAYLSFSLSLCVARLFGAVREPTQRYLGLGSEARMSRAIYKCCMDEMSHGKSGVHTASCATVGCCLKSVRETAGCACLRVCVFVCSGACVSVCLYVDVECACVCLYYSHSNVIISIFLRVLILVLQTCQYSSSTVVIGDGVALVPSLLHTCFKSLFDGQRRR